MIKKFIFYALLIIFAAIIWYIVSPKWYFYPTSKEIKANIITGKIYILKNNQWVITNKLILTKFTRSIFKKAKLSPSEELINKIEIAKEAGYTDEEIIEYLIEFDKTKIDFRPLKRQEIQEKYKK